MNFKIAATLFPTQFRKAPSEADTSKKFCPTIPFSYYMGEIRSR